MAINDLINLWTDGVIPFRGRKELIKRFLETFDFSTADSFHQIIREEKVATPLQFEWLAVEIPKYHKYYKSIEAVIEV